MTEFNTLEAALGFGAGVVFMAGVMWTFVVSPDRKRIDALELKEAGAQKELREFMNRILRKAGYDV